MSRSHARASLRVAPFTIQARSVCVSLVGVLQKSTARSGEQTGARSHVRAVSIIWASEVFLPKYSVAISSPTMAAPILRRLPAFLRRCKIHWMICAQTMTRRFFWKFFLKAKPVSFLGRTVAGSICVGAPGIGRNLQRLERNIGMANEAFGIFVRFWLTSTPSISETAQAAARAKAGERYDGFLSALGRRLAKRPKLRQVISEEFGPPPPDTQ